MASRPEIDGAWVALSRDSNLRCAWCHTAQTGFRATDDMPFELLQEIVGLASDLGVGNVTLTGVSQPYTRTYLTPSATARRFGPGSAFPRTDWHVPRATVWSGS